MKQDEFTKYSDMCIRIKRKMDDIQVSLRYGLTNNDKDFLEKVNDLIKEHDKVLHRMVSDLLKEE